MLGTEESLAVNEEGREENLQTVVERGACGEQEVEVFNSRRRLSIFADIFANSIIDFASASAIPSVSHVVSCAFDILSYMLMFHSSVLL